MLSVIRMSSVLLLLSAAAVAAEPRSVTVTGTGFASVAPDLAYVRMSVVERNLSLETAQQTAAAITARVLKLTDQLDIARQRVNTTGASVRPEYRWNRDKDEQELIGYVAERSIEVEVRNLDKLGELIEGAVKAGVKQLQQPVLDSSERRNTYRAALTLAAEDARANAVTLAAALDARLGAIVTVNATSGGHPPPQPMLRMQADMLEESAAQSYSAGDIRFEATINAVFSLLD